LRGDLIVSTGIKNAYIECGNSDICALIDPSMQDYLDPRDRYGHPSLAIPENHFNGSTYYAGWIYKHTNHIKVYLHSGRYQNKALSELQRADIELYLAMKFMQAFGDQDICFYDSDFSVDELVLFLKGRSFRTEKSGRTYSRAIIENETLYRLFQNNDIDKAILNNIDLYGCTWLHKAVYYKHVKLVQRLIAEGADLSIRTPENQQTPYANMTALDIALSCNSYNIVAVFLMKHVVKECSELDKYDALTHLSQELCQLASNTGNLTEERKAELLFFVIQYPYFLTCELDKDGYTFLHRAFAANHSPIIDELTLLPQWEQLSWTVNKKNHWSLFDVIANGGFLDHYDLLQHLLTSESGKAYAVKLSVRRGHEAFCARLFQDGCDPYCHYEDETLLMMAAKRGNAPLCMLLLERGANPSIPNKAGEIAENIWGHKYPLRLNPFKRYRQIQLFEQKKAEILRLLSLETKDNGVISCVSGATLLLTSLQQAIMHAQFIEPKKSS
jgi:ankyrin repeat protein